MERRKFIPNVLQTDEGLVLSVADVWNRSDVEEYAEDMNVTLTPGQIDRILISLLYLENGINVESIRFAISETAREMK
jgi:hypothetical protein